MTAQGCDWREVMNPDVRDKGSSGLLWTAYKSLHFQVEPEINTNCPESSVEEM